MRHSRSYTPFRAVGGNGAQLATADAAYCNSSSDMKRVRPFVMHGAPEKGPDDDDPV